MKEKLERVFKETDFKYYMCILIVACILAIPILNKNLDIYWDDGIQHIARAYGTLQSIKEQGLYPNVISNFANGFGYSWNLFYGPLSSYLMIVLSFICKSFVTSYKILNFICLILSGFFMYKLVMSLTKNSNTALLASVIYLTFPYHLTDWYSRNALGEFMSFMFVPLVFLGLYQLFNTEENHYYITFGAVGLILTHNISTLLTAIFALIYVAINFKGLKETHVKKGLLLNFVFIVLITSFFWAPMLETKFTTEYQVYEDGAMATAESVAENALTVTQLFVTKEETKLVFELGIHIIIMLCFSVMALKNLNGNLKKQYIFCLVCGLLCILMSTKLWPWKIMPKAMLMIQFPWRMLFLAGFFLSIVCSINMFIILKKFEIKDVIILSIICVLYVCAFASKIPEYEKIEIEDWVLGKMTGKEVEVIAGTAKAEYLPKKAFDNRFYIATRENGAKVLSENTAIVEDEIKYGSSYEAKVKTVDRTTLELPYIYYPGYKVTADGIGINAFETENGFLGVEIEANEDVKVEVDYIGTNIMKISLLLSVLGTIAFSAYVWKKH